MKYFLLIIFLLFLNGCSFKQMKPTNYYALELKKELPTFKTTQQTIAIEKPILNAPYNSKNIFFTQKPYIYEKYSVNKWIEFPDIMVENMLHDTVKNSLLFKHTSIQNSKQITNLTLQSRVMKLLHSYKETQSFALVEIEFTIRQKNEVLNTLIIKKEILCEENSPYGFVKASNLAFEEISLEILTHIKNKFSVELK